MYFDRFDICEAYFIFSVLWHNGGKTKRCDEKNKSISQQLNSIDFQPGISAQNGEFNTENSKYIYLGLIKKYHPEYLENEINELELESTEQCIQP